MIKKLEFLEERSTRLEISSALQKEYEAKIQEYARSFIDSTETNKTYTQEIGNWSELAIVNEDPQSLDDILKNFEDNVVKPGLNPASGGHLGYIPGGGIIPSAWADYLAAITNRYAGVYFGGPGAVEMENAIIEWTRKIFGYPEGSYGNLCSGGSIANLIAFTTARKAKGIKARHIEKSVIYLSSHTHHCIQKAIRIIGMEECVIREVPLDQYFRMDITSLKAMIENDVDSGLVPFMVVASAGTTDVGAVDPLEKIGVLCAQNNIWYHIDAAYGGFFYLVDELQSKFKGIEMSDSLVVDPHKGLFLPYGLGIIITRHRKALFESHYYQANYMQDALQPKLSPADHSPELTKHFRGLRLWLPLKLFGLDPFIAGLEEKTYLCRYFYEEIQKYGFEVGPYPELSVCIYRFTQGIEEYNQFNQSLIKNVHADGRVFVSSTTINGEIWLRLAVLAFRTHKVTIDKCIEMLIENVEKTKMEMGL